MLGFHSPNTASPATGHTTLLPFPIGRGPASPIYMKPFEGWIWTGLLLVAVIVPVLYLARMALRRR
jgi:hypothetical protein